MALEMLSTAHKMSIKLLLITSLITVVDLRHLSNKNFSKRRKETIKVEKATSTSKPEPKDFEYLDDAIHYRSGDKMYSDWKKIDDFEDDFRRSFAMEGIKYTYKRDLYWRTRRKVTDGTGVPRMINYKCNNLFMKNNSSGCDSCGSWTIEESPPCPYEFFSIIDDDRMCAYKYLQNNDFKDNCPSVMKFTDLDPSCDNPMETLWRFTKVYNSSKEYSPVICNGMDYCEVFTTYLITPTKVIFRIINTTNDVIYSKIMKPNNTNYVCVNDCGRYDPQTKEIRKSDSPLRLNLFLPSFKNKKELNDYKDVDLSMAKPGFKKRHLSLLLTNGKGGKMRIIEKEFKHLRTKTTVSEEYINNLISPEATTTSSCKKVQKIVSVEEDYEFDDYEYNDIYT